MVRGNLFHFAIAALLFTAAGLRPAVADPLPARIGECSRTTIASIGTRLVDGATGRPMANSGSAVEFANGGHQVSYDTVPEISASRIGDPVMVCLVSLPQNCPPGDNRGREDRTINLRTNQSWRLPDSQHTCGGA